MGRRSNKYSRKTRPLSLGLSQTSDHKQDGSWITRPISGERATKEYICPGCNQVIRKGVSHIVVWPATPPLGSNSGLDHRRHWHNSCWKRKS
ncbi:MAG: hypothetical protein CR979_00465 [Propionibacterium sp.]|nr:MAG: hypothetical protein CR979_00465 [Propionibacterium sp.]